MPILMCGRFERINSIDSSGDQPCLYTQKSTQHSLQSHIDGSNEKKMWSNAKGGGRKEPTPRYLKNTFLTTFIAFGSKKQNGMVISLVSFSKTKQNRTQTMQLFYLFIYFIIKCWLSSLYFIKGHRLLYYSL